MLLDTLNQLLANPDLELPFHKRKVDPSGGNLVWLRKNFSKRNKNQPVIESLLDKSIGELTKE